MLTKEQEIIQKEQQKRNAAYDALEMARKSERMKKEMETKFF